MRQTQEPIPCKIILLGDSYVGKTTLLQKYIGEGDPDCYYATLGVEQKLKTIALFNQTINLRIWDAAGVPKLRHLVKTYLHEAHGALICFDVTKTSSLHNVDTFVELFRQHQKNAPIILVGCKTDLKRVVSTEQAQAKAEQLGVVYIETSGSKKTNVDEVFTQLIQQIFVLKVLSKIKPELERQFTNYAKTYNKTNTHSLFGTKSTQEGCLKKEYQHNLQQLFQATHFSELDTFLQKTVQLIKKADDLHQQENPILGLITTSTLSTMLQQTLDALYTIADAADGWPYLNELVARETTSSYSR
ncbi:Rab family GTPase [Legionella drancourtii]|uniref:Ras family GTPase n=1 Tax=Legionella drancourtii LLAP12 TaxID=658187 RepID=G9EQ02_9GAMM|nr:Rab family GTPase [Legionella drancourtii]EHL30577.1 hypothetical protein LDG_7344 [Legionella drancourtii LLAP12]